MAPSDIIKKYFRPGVVLGNRYQIEKLVGAGAYSAIFSAIDSEKGTRVAIKAVPPLGDGGKKTSIGRFQREMKVIGKLRHENIISLFDFGETEELIGYMVLEFIKGQTLFDIVDGNPMNNLNAIDVTRQIAMALRVAHERGVIHRDLKPQNVMLIRKESDKYLVKVLDFGMAKLTRRIDADESIEELTREGIAVGTPRYIAPEQARGKDVGPYSDLYALGLLMYEMFTGERAVKADTVESAIRAHVSSTPHEFQELDHVPIAMHNILFKLTAKQVGRRYQNATELIEDLNLVEKEFAGDKTIEDNIDNDPTTAYDFRNSPRRKIAQAHPDFPVEKGKKAGVKAVDTRSLAPEKREIPRPTIDRNRPQKYDIRWGALLSAGLLFPFAFVIGSAAFYNSPSVLRFFLGCLPLIFCSMSLVRGNENLSPQKVLFVSSLIWILFPHLFLQHDLGVGLWSHSTWFLEPFQNLPAMQSLIDIIAEISRAYVEFLISISDAFSPR